MNAIARNNWVEPRRPASAPSVQPEDSGRLHPIHVAQSPLPDTHDRFSPAMPDQTLTRQMSSQPRTHPIGATPGLGRRFYLACGKRTVDIAMASVLLVVFLPLLLIASAWIALDARANPLFLQQRVGRGGGSFTLLKLRTMAPSSTTQLVWLTDEHGGRRHKIPNDPRVTRPGQFLRRTSIDELPQLWNVIRGDMSLIGPRPELPEIVATYASWQHPRHTVRPGLTGWWQVSGRSDRPMHDHTDLDIYYIDHLSPFLDIAIAAKTVRVVLRGHGAF